MFANSSLKEYSVINLDMIYKYVFSSYTESANIAEDAYLPYADSDIARIIYYAVGTDQMYLCPNRYETSTGSERKILDDFTWHPGGPAAMDGKYGDGVLEGKAPIMVQDSIALNPYILYGGAIFSGTVTSPTENVRPSVAAYYIIMFKNGKKVSATTTFEIDDSLVRNTPFPITGSDFSVSYASGRTSLTESEVKNFGEVYYIEYDHRELASNVVGYNCDLDETDGGGVCLNRKNLVWKRTFNDDIVDADAYVTEKDIVDSNFSGASQYDIGMCIYEGYDYIIRYTGSTTAMTWKYIVKMYDDTMFPSGSTYGVTLYDNNGDVKVSRRTLSWAASSTTYRSGSTSFNKLLPDETPYFADWEWLTGASGFSIYSSVTTTNGSVVTSTLLLKPLDLVDEYSVTLFTFTKRTYSNTHYVVFVTNDRSGVTKRLEGNFTDDSSSDQWGYDSKTTIMVADGDTLTFEMGADTAKWEDVAFQGGNLGGEGITNFPFVHTTLGVVERGTNTTDTSPQIVGSTHFYDTGDAAIRIFMNFEQ